MGWMDKLTYRIGPPETAIKEAGYRDFLTEFQVQWPNGGAGAFVFVYRGQKLLLTVALRFLIDKFETTGMITGGFKTWSERFATFATRYLRRAVNQSFLERTQESIGQKDGRPLDRIRRKRKRQNRH